MDLNDGPEQKPEATRSPLFFNAHHSPIGAFASLTLGAQGARGGFGVELGGPPQEDVYIGVESEASPGTYLALPFFSENAPENERVFDVESLGGISRPRQVTVFTDEAIVRTLGAGVDEWRAGDLRFRLISPPRGVPDPESCETRELADAIAPAILAELIVDNRHGAMPRRAFFGYSGSNAVHAMRAWSKDGLAGIEQGPVSIATDAPGSWSGVGFQPEAILDPKHWRNLRFMLGRVGLIAATVPPGEKRTLRFAISFYRDGWATSEPRARYLFRRCFEGHEQVLRFALARFEEFSARAASFDKSLRETLTFDRAFMLSHAIRSYYGSTQLLEFENGRPLWVVNEGEYRMMNTLDLTVDQAHFELSMNPWTVRNALEFHAQNYSRQDDFGISFTHDIGVANAFAETGNSAYEQAGHGGCFSMMCCEELANWVLCACLYGLRAGDSDWLDRHAGLLECCFLSLCNRDHPEPSERDGVMGFDSPLCEGGVEITTYDSLDPSLGQARSNAYLATKCWAAYVLLAEVFSRTGLLEAAEASTTQARRCAATLAGSADASGLIPALLEGGSKARTIPVIEGLAFPALAGLSDAVRPDGPYAELISTLKRHVGALLSIGECRFASGAWKLSSSSRNSWLSKIYLCQYVTERVFEMPPDQQADHAHLRWLLRPANTPFAWSDQMLDGVAVGSRYYPRGVTAYLWLDGLPAAEQLLHGKPLAEVNR